MDTYLCSYKAGFEPREVGVGPVRLWPRFDEAQVRREVERAELIVHKFTYVPR